MLFVLVAVVVVVDVAVAIVVVAVGVVLGLVRVCGRTVEEGNTQIYYKMKKRQM